MAKLIGKVATLKWILPMEFPIPIALAGGWVIGSGVPLTRLRNCGGEVSPSETELQIEDAKMIWQASLEIPVFCRDASYGADPHYLGSEQGS